MNVRVDWRTSVSLVGSILMWLTVPLAPSLLLAFYDGTDVVPFAVTVGVTLGVGYGLRGLTDDYQLYDREAFLMVAASWLAVALLGALPFVLSGSGVLADPVNAAFESMSGVTTTGATVFQEFDVHSRPVLLWRQMLQWLGGLGILVVATAVLSRLGVGGAQLMETESQTQDVRKLTPGIEDTARILAGLYAALTALAAATLYGLGLVGRAPEMTLFDAVAHALSSVSTAGFSPRAQSIAAFSPAVQWALVVFMFLGATNFVLMYLLLQGNVHRLRESEEFRFYVLVLGTLSGLLAVLLVVEGDAYATHLETVRHAVFQVVSLVTTTGYASTDYELWAAPGKQVLFMCLFVGGMAGSTTCSIKTLRWLIIVKSFNRDLFVAAKPDAVRPVRLSDQAVDEETIRDVYAYTLLSLLIFIFATVVVVMVSSGAGHPLTEFEALGAVGATFFNVGPAFGQAGPFGTYAGFPAVSKGFMTVLMWVGRIEIIPVLVMVRLSFWRSP